VGTVTCDVQYSGRVGALCCAAAVATGAVVFAMPLGIPWRVAALAWIAAACCLALRSLARVSALTLDADGAMHVRLDGAWRRGRVRDGSVVLPWLTVVRWRPDGAWFDRAVLLVPPMVPSDAFRTLRVLLRWAKP
jgi:hypothetical protein